MSRNPLFIGLALLLLSCNTFAESPLTAGKYMILDGGGTLTITKTHGDTQFSTEDTNNARYICDLHGTVNGFTSEIPITAPEEGGQRTPCIVQFKESNGGICLSSPSSSCRDYLCDGSGDIQECSQRVSPECTAPGKQIARDQFTALYNKKQFKRASSILKSQLIKCDAVLSYIERGEILNYLAMTQYKLKEKKGCLNTLRKIDIDPNMSDEELRETLQPNVFDHQESIIYDMRKIYALCNTL